MQEVSSLLPIRDKSYEDLREVLDIVRVNRRHLLSLLTPTQLVDYQFLHQIEQLLDAEGRREWEMSRRVNELPSLEQMFAFLEQRSSCIASLAMGTISSRARPANARDEQCNAQKSIINSTQRGSGSSQSALTSHQGRRAPTLLNEQKRPVDNRKCFKCELPGRTIQGHVGHRSTRFRPAEAIVRIVLQPKSFDGYLSQRSMSALSGHETQQLDLPKQQPAKVRRHGRSDELRGRYTIAISSDDRTQWPRCVGCRRLSTKIG